MPAARYQYIHRTIGSVSGTNTKENLFKQNFSTLCPVVTIKYRPNDNWFFQLNYRKNLTQPNFCSVKFLTCLPRIAFNGQVNINNAFTPNIYLLLIIPMYNQKSIHSWNMGAAASLLKNRLNINLAINDILGKANYNNILYHFNNVDWGTRGKNDMRGVELTISYTIFNKEVKC